ncbi:hypothetical protein ACFVTX_05710 [Agromyces sp. NPDC058136]|uniref:hypothetical protein n=1 Tax=Agromyces sp. NPDC058136 TaxID=3346354 RepID=UPI0036DC9772
MSSFPGYETTVTHQSAPVSGSREAAQPQRIPTPPALVALYILSAVPGLVGAALAIVGLINGSDVTLLLTGVYLVLATFGLYFFLVLPLVAIIQAIHQTIRLRRN